MHAFNVCWISSLDFSLQSLVHVTFIGEICAMVQQKQAWVCEGQTPDLPGHRQLLFNEGLLAVECTDHMVYLLTILIH